MTDTERIDWLATAIEFCDSDNPNNPPYFLLNGTWAAPNGNDIRAAIDEKMAEGIK